MGKEFEFIKFTSLQRRLLNEINRRHGVELSSVVKMIADDLGVDLSDELVSYRINPKMTGFMVIKQPSEKSKENKTNGKETGLSTEEEVSMEDPLQRDGGDV